MRILRDPDAHTRAWIAMMQGRFRARGEAIPEDLNADRLPPTFEVPWDRATAEERLKPFSGTSRRSSPMSLRRIFGSAGSSRAAAAMCSSQS